MTETLADRIQQRLDILELSEQAASVKATGKKDTIRMIRTGRTQSPRADTLAALARALETTEHWLLHGDETSTNQRPKRPPEVSGPISIPAVIDLPKDVPVFGTASGSALGGKNGAIQMSNDVIEYVRRPPGLASTMGAYAVYVENESMFPRFMHGDLAYVHPTRPARVGDDVILQVQDGPNAELETYIKTLKRRTAEHVLCEQYNPPGDVRFITPNVKLMHKVLTTAELMGI